MKRSRCRRWYEVLVVLLASLLVSPVASDAQSNRVTFSGQATAIRAMALGQTVSLADAGSLPSTGGAQEASFLTANVLGVATAEVLHASTIGQGDRTRSEASLANLSLAVGGNNVAASFLMARATAVCAPQGASVSGSSEIADLVINGQLIAITGGPNQTVPLPNGRVVINEQNSSASNKTADITVNALHVVVTGIADIVISSVHADITCTGKPVCTGGDFVTGGGWIIGTPSGAKGNFGVAGGIKNGAFWGHLTFIDHGPNGPKVKGTSVTAYSVVNATTRRIEGTAEINGQSGFTYLVDVADNGEPGRNDSFALQLSNGYSAAGNLEGGNIQLHQPCK